MNFTATIRRPSFVFRTWRDRGQLFGELSGVRFKWNGKDYVAVNEPLEADDVAALLPNRFAVVTTFGLPVGVVKPVAPPVEPHVEIVEPESMVEKTETEEAMEKVAELSKVSAAKTSPTITRLTLNAKK